MRSASTKASAGVQLAFSFPEPELRAVGIREEGHELIKRLNAIRAARGFFLTGGGELPRHLKEHVMRSFDLAEREVERQIAGIRIRLKASGGDDFHCLDGDEIPFSS